MDRSERYWEAATDDSVRLKADTTRSAPAMVRFCLSAYRNAGLSVQRAKLIPANALGGGRDYQFHPNGIRTLEIRSLGRLAQGVHAVLLLPGVRVGETRQLEHNP